MKLLLLALMVVTGASFAGTERVERGKRLKPRSYRGLAVVGEIVSWRLLRHYSYKLIRGVTDKVEKTARRSRMQLSIAPKVEVTDLPLYRLTAPDGSQHHIFGTLHISNLNISDFPKDSKLFPILEQANILIPEFFKVSNLRDALRAQKARPVAVQQQKLSKQLGRQYWKKLTQMITAKPELRQFEPPIDKLMIVIDSSTADVVYKKLLKYGRNYAAPVDGLLMDYQLIYYGLDRGKTLIGLETFEQTRSMALKAQSEKIADVDDLKKLIDKGGIDYVADTITDAIHRYAKGKKISLADLLPASSDKTAYYDFIFGQRNIAWLQSGKIQKNCVNGNKCLIFVGVGHLDKGNNTLIKLLQKQGYQIERL